MPTAALRGSASLVIVFVSLYFISCVVVTGEAGAAAPRLADATESSNVYHLDLLQLQQQQEERSDAAAVAPTTTPWFDGFGAGTLAAAGAVAVATVGHPIRRMLLHLRQEGVGLDQGMSWAERGGMRYRQ